MNVVAVDVGSAGVRVAIVTFDGREHREARILSSKERDIRYYQNGERFEQSSEEIWQAVCECTRACLVAADHVPIHGIGFSATCSLVIQEGEGKEASAPAASPRNVIMWMDHRAIEEAKFITDNKSPVLDQLGGVCSPEFSLAKILWLKNAQLERLSSNETSLFELPDWLVWRCTSAEPERSSRSLCCVTCKWGYNSEERRNCDIIEAIGNELSPGKFAQQVLKPGTIAGHLSHRAALELGIIKVQQASNGRTLTGDGATNELRPNVVVGTSLIDAHSGMLAMLSAKPRELAIEDTFCSLAGTSSCHMLLSREKKFCRGVWGPYKDVVLDGYYLLESGQTLTGRLIEICIERSREAKRLLDAGKPMKQIIQSLNEQIEAAGTTASELHTLPTFHGNRSPLANARLAGGVYGLTARAEPSLLHTYISSVEAIAFETKLIVETLNIGHLGNILVSGGLMKNKFYMQTLADVLGCRAIKMGLKGVDFMVMGSALVARCAILSADRNGREHAASEALDEACIGGIKYEQLHMETFEPSNMGDPARAEYLKKKYACYKEFVHFSQRVDEILHCTD